MKNCFTQPLKLFLWGVTGVFISLSGADELIYSPALDPACEVQGLRSVKKRNAAYMWYPGQLAAHVQGDLLGKSAERCVYVGYPGKFNPPGEKSFFRRCMKVEKDTLVKWEGSSTVSCSVNGEKLESGKCEVVLQPGDNNLLFEVNSPGRLPALIFEEKEPFDKEKWESSLDGVSWVGVESGSSEMMRGKFPDDEQEAVYRIPPRKISCLKNSKEEGGKLAFLTGGEAIVDFFHLEVGVLKFKAKGTGRLTVRVGESVEEVNNREIKDFEQKPLSDIVLNGGEQEIVLPERALRFVKIESEGDCILSDMCFEARLWPVECQMTFSCDDPGLNALWNAGVATLHSCLHGFYLDGLKRDYLPWSMDTVISALGGNYLFGDEQASRNGISIALPPTNPLRKDLGIIDYPLHALIALKHHYLRFGDLHTSLLYKDRIVSMLDLYISLQDENGFISPGETAMGFVPGWATLTGPGSRDTTAYGQIMLCLNFRMGAYFARLWGESGRAEDYERRAARLRESIRKHFWDEGSRAFINGYTAEGKKDVRITHHAQYWAIIADIFPPEHYDHLFDKVLPAIPYYKDFISYEKGYEFLAYIKAGRSRDIFPFLNSVWGKWLEDGHTRFPENFSPQADRKSQLVFYSRPFGLSLCHGANGIPPVVAVLHGLAGFSQSDVQPDHYSISPDLMHLQRADIRIPVKEGVMELKLRKAGKSTVELPENCTLDIFRPNSEERIQRFEKAGTHEFVCP